MGSGKKQVELAVKGVVHMDEGWHDFSGSFIGQRHIKGMSFMPGSDAHAPKRRTVDSPVLDARTSSTVSEGKVR